MQKQKICSRCHGRMFLESDYLGKGYDYNCISCGHVEPFAKDGSDQVGKPAVVSPTEGRKARDYSLA